MASYRYWRLSNIVDLGYQDTGLLSSIALIKFLNPSGALATPDLSKVFSNVNMDGGRSPKFAFDGNLTKIAHTEDRTGGFRSEEWYIGYDFGSEVEVTRVGIQARQDLSPPWLEEWQRCLVEGSNDGETWVLQGQCLFNTPSGDKTYQEKPIIPLDEQTDTKRRYWRVSQFITLGSTPKVAPSTQLFRLRFDTLEKVEC